MSKAFYDVCRRTALIIAVFLGLYWLLTWLDPDFIARFTAMSIGEFIVMLVLIVIVYDLYATARALAAEIDKLKDRISALEAEIESIKKEYDKDLDVCR